MKQKTLIKVFLIVSLLLSLSGLIYSQGFQVQQIDEFEVLLSDGASLALQTENHVVQVSAESNMNGSSCTIWITENGGSFRFTPENQTSIEITLHDVSVCKINGEGVQNNSDWTLIAATQYNIEWGYTTGWLLPLRPIIGIVGIVLLFASSLKTASTLKHSYKDWIPGLVTAIILGSLGISLFIIWLWG